MSTTTPGASPDEQPAARPRRPRRAEGTGDPATVTEPLPASPVAAATDGHAPEVTSAWPRQKPASGHSRLEAVGMFGIDGVPARYQDGVEWLRAGVKRHPWAVAVALVTGWTGIWLAFWAAVAGLVLGIVVALGLIDNNSIGVFLFHIGVGQAVTVLSVFGGAALGAIGGLLIVPKIIFVDHPLQALGAVASGAVVTAIVVVAVATFERPLLRFRGYRRLSRDEVRRVAPLVKNAADAMNLPALPRFGMSDMLVPNAWTHMRTIVITKGLLQTLDDPELTAVLAHELQHWRSGDAVGARIVWAAALPVALVCNLGLFLAGRGRGEGLGRPPVAVGTFLVIIGWIIAWPAWAITKLIIVPVTASTQRGYEYEADAAAARIGLATALSSALRKMGAFEGGRTGWEQTMAATHPPTELRLEALQQPRPDDFEYQEDDLRVPRWKEIRRFLFGLREILVPDRSAQTTMPPVTQQSADGDTA